MTAIAPSPTARRRSRGLAGLAAGAIGFLAHWTPVWIPLALLAQFSLRGLRPALAETRRLSACESELSFRLEEHLERSAELRSLHEALADPIYRERLRLARGDE